MSEAYYLSGNVAANPAEAIQEALDGAHARLHWVEEAFCLSSKDTPLLPGLPVACPLTTWSPQPSLDTLTLQPPAICSFQDNGV